MNERRNGFFEQRVRDAARPRDGDVIEDRECGVQRTGIITRVLMLTADAGVLSSDRFDAPSNSSVAPQPSRVAATYQTASMRSYIRRNHTHDSRKRRG